MSAMDSYHEGVLEKKQDKWIKYWGVVRDQRLLFYKKRNVDCDPDEVVGSIQLSRKVSVKVTKTKHKSYQFLVRTERGQHLFKCQSREERDEWVKVLSWYTSSAPTSDSYEQELSVSHKPLACAQSMSSLVSVEEPLNLHHRPLPAQPTLEHISLQPLVPASLRPSCEGASGPHLTLPSVSRSWSWSCTQSLPPSRSQVSGMNYNDQQWYYGPILRSFAEELLYKFGAEGSFLLRQSKTSPGTYSLSFREVDGEANHYKILPNCHDQFLLIGLEGKAFSNLVELVQYYIDIHRGSAVPLTRLETGYRLDRPNYVPPFANSLFGETDSLQYEEPMQPKRAGIGYQPPPAVPPLVPPPPVPPLVPPPPVPPPPLPEESPPARDVPPALENLWVSLPPEILPAPLKKSPSTNDLLPLQPSVQLEDDTFSLYEESYQKMLPSPEQFPRQQDVLPCRASFANDQLFSDNLTYDEAEHALG